MIPEAAVEAAYRTLPYTMLPHLTEEDMHLALEAAAPHLLVASWDEAFEEGRERGEWEAAPVTREPVFTNPYRSQV